MDLNEAFKCVGLSAVLGIYGVVMPVSADTRVFTASIDSKGKVLVQSPDWIAGVVHNVQPGYFSDYKVKFVPGVFKHAPGFCTVSVTDVDSYDDLFSGHAKLRGSPTSSYVNVLSLEIGSAGSTGETSLSFMLMCIK